MFFSSSSSPEQCVLSKTHTHTNLVVAEHPFVSFSVLSDELYPLGESERPIVLSSFSLFPLGRVLPHYIGSHSIASEIPKTLL